MTSEQRIENLSTELQRLRQSRHEQNGELQTIVVGLAEIKLNLATQDRTLGKLDHAINGNGSAGLIVRVDRAERSLASYARFLWLMAGGLAALLVKSLVLALHV